MDKIAIDLFKKILYNKIIIKPKNKKQGEFTMAKAASLEAFKDNNEVSVIDTTKRIRIGIIGTGWIAESHLASLLKQPDIDVVAGADIIPGKAEAFFKKFGGFAKIVGMNGKLLFIVEKKEMVVQNAP